MQLGIRVKQLVGGSGKKTPLTSGISEQQDKGYLYFRWNLKAYGGIIIYFELLFSIFLNSNFFIFFTPFLIFAPAIQGIKLV
jgi:hypothetical protein